MRGRKPKPTALRRSEGNPGKRRIKGRADLAGDPAAPQPPSWIDAEGRVVWNQVVRELAPLKILRKPDQIALVSLCTAVSLFRKALRKFGRYRFEAKKAGKDADDALLVRTPNGAIQQNPLISIINQQQVAIGRWVAELGLSPAARARLLLEEGSGDADLDYEELLNAPRPDEDDSELRVN